MPSYRRVHAVSANAQNMAGLVQQDNFRPLSTKTFQRDLDRFERYIAEIALQKSDVSADDKRANMKETLRYDDFCEKVRLYFGPDIKTDDIKAIFRKISNNPEVKIEWSEVFGYFQSENDERQNSGEEISVFTVSKKRKIGEAAGDKRRRDVIQCIAYSQESDMFVVASQKGVISIYNGKLRLQSCIDVNEPAWVTSCEYLPTLRKIIATTERSIVVWDHRAKATAKSNIFVIKPLEHSPQSICLLPTKDGHSDSVLIGDDAGFVNLIKLTPNDFVSHNDSDPQKPVVSQVIDPASLLVPIVRRKVHPDWVLKITYIAELKSFASCSPSDKTSFVISDLRRLHDNRPFNELSIPRGVNAFAYSEKSNIFATGGVDKIIRVWHPNILSRPTGKMTGHLFTITAVVINDKDQHIISLSTARVFRVWDIHTLSCLQVFSDTERKSIDRRISSLLFDGHHDRLFTGSNIIEMWPMTRTVQDNMSVPHTHDQPISAVAKNPLQRQILSACSESTIKVWEVETGRQMYHILDAHGSGIEITTACVDSTGTYMATGAIDGSIKVWEFSSGKELKSFMFGSGTDDDQTVTWIYYMNQSQASCKFSKDYSDEGHDKISGDGNSIGIKRRFLAVGWNNKLLELQEENDGDEVKIVKMFDGEYKTTSSTGLSEPCIEKNLLLCNEITCCSWMDEPFPPITPPLLLTGCSNGNIILWNYDLGAVHEIFELKNSGTSSLNGNSKKYTKETHPFRVNALGYLNHRIVRYAPKEVKRRGKVRKENIQQMNEENNRPQIIDTIYAETGKSLAENLDDSMKEDKNQLKTSDGHTESTSPDTKKTVWKPNEMILVEFPTVLVSCHHDSNVRFWSVKGELILILASTTKNASPVTAMTHDEYSDNLFVADTKGYITMWDVSQFLETRYSTEKKVTPLQVISWRAHLMNIAALMYIEESRCLISSSSDGSVRLWYPQRAHYVGYFGQQRVWNLTHNLSLPLHLVLPYDINEMPVKSVNVSGRMTKPRAKKYDYPLIFDAEKWKPFQRSTHDSEILQRSTTLPREFKDTNALEVKDKKFFNALVKPKANKTNLESSKPAEPESGAIFRALPVYRLATPPRQPSIPTLGVIIDRSMTQPKKKSVGRIQEECETTFKVIQVRSHARESANHTQAALDGSPARRR